MKIIYSETREKIKILDIIHDFQRRIGFIMIY